MSQYDEDQPWLEPMQKEQPPEPKLKHRKLMWAIAVVSLVAVSSVVGYNVYAAFVLNGHVNYSISGTQAVIYDIKLYAGATEPSGGTIALTCNPAPPGPSVQCEASGASPG